MATDKQSLIREAARELFREQGFRATAVSDITGRAGVAVGSFYRHFASKEALFIELFIEENTALKHQLLAAVDHSAPPSETVGALMRSNVAGMQTNPILREWTNPAVAAEIERLYRDQGGASATEFLYDPFLALVAEWQDRGLLRRDLEPAQVMEVFGAVITVEMNKHDLGIESAAIDLMLDLVLRGLAPATAPGGINPHDNPHDERP